MMCPVSAQGIVTGITAPALIAVSRKKNLCHVVVHNNTYRFSFSVWFSLLVYCNDNVVGKVRTLPAFCFL